MIEKIINIAKKKFIRNVIILASGTAAAQMVVMVLNPFITRLYGPEAYGLMGTFLAVISIITPVAALTYPIAIVLSIEDRDSRGLISLSIITTLIISVITGLFLLFFKHQIISIFSLQSLDRFLFLVPFVVFSAGILEIIEQWLIRFKQFSVSAKATFLNAIFINGGMVAFGFINPSSTVLIIFSASKQIVKAILLLVINRNYSNRFFDSLFGQRSSIKELANKYRDFPLLRAPEILLNSISTNLPILLLTIFFGPKSVGFYVISLSVLGIPSQLIGKSVGDVFYPHITEAANNNESLANLVKKSTLSLAVLGFLPFSMVILFGPWLFGFVFGTEWVTAGEYARWIALWSFFGFINQPSIRALPVLSALSYHLMYTIIVLIIRVLVVTLGFYIFNSDIMVIALFGITGALLNLGLLLIIINLCKRHDKVAIER